MIAEYMSKHHLYCLVQYSNFAMLSNVYGVNLFFCSFCSKDIKKINEIFKSMVKQFSLFSVLMSTIFTCAVFLPFFGLCFGVLWSLLFDFKHATNTHCHVSNYLPSVSAAISLAPQSYVWRICIALHISLRYLITYCYWHFFSKQTYISTKLLFPLIPFLRASAIIFNLIEVSALLGLSLISSVENFKIHEVCFILFTLGGFLFMLFACLLNAMIYHDTEKTKRSARRKKAAFICYVTALLLSFYAYYRHNKYCEPGVYTLFALFEYTAIISNMWFHYTFATDLKDYSLCVIDVADKL